MNLIFRFFKSRTKTGDSIHRQFQAKQVFVQQLDNSLISENDAFQLVMTSLLFYPRKKTWFHLEPGAVDECVTLIIYIRCYDCHKQIAPKYDHIVNCWQYIVGVFLLLRRCYNIYLWFIVASDNKFTSAMDAIHVFGAQQTRYSIYTVDPCVSVFSKLNLSN